MKTNSTHHLFDVFGIELEYMIADRDTLSVLPIADLLFRDKTGEIVSDIEHGNIDWSNELVAHLVELKTASPDHALSGCDKHFSANISEINKLLEKYNAMLLPTAAHPTMDPHKEMRLWEHGYNEIYSLYNRVFDCRGHGWANLQSTHINLPFSGDDEFEKLHAAIRLILPLIPALCASSPILDGTATGFKDSRMNTYLHNQDRMPQLTGRLIPERVYSEAEYNRVIFSPITEAMKPFDKENIMEKYFLNARGAIARFDRGAIEIRVAVIQEAPSADIAIAMIIAETIKMTAEQRWADLEIQKIWHEEKLRSIFLEVIRDGESAVIEDREYLKLFGIDEKNLTASEFWSAMLQQVSASMEAPYSGIIQSIIDNGTLSSRIMEALNGKMTRKNIHAIYKDLAINLTENRLFIP